VPKASMAGVSAIVDLKGVRYRCYDRCASSDLIMNRHSMKTYLEPTDESGRAFPAPRRQKRDPVAGRHPQVAQAIDVPAPDDTNGQIPVASVAAPGTHSSPRLRGARAAGRAGG
jgi:hypothetical protein